MPRKKRPLERGNEFVRDAILIVIASEDEFAVELYFERFRTSRLKFRVLPTNDGRSSPQDISNRLDEFRAEFSLNEDDQLWFCGDVDHWAQPNHIPNLTAVLQHCRQCRYQVALSNPCFELWILLHFVDQPSIPEAPCSGIAAELRQAAAGYSKSGGCGSPLTTDMVHDAIRRAKTLDTDPSDIPARPMTRVYRIVEELLKRQAIELH